MQKSSCVSLLDLFSSRMEKPTDFPQLSHRSHATRSASETCVKKKMNRKRYVGEGWPRATREGEREKKKKKKKKKTMQGRTETERIPNIYIRMLGKMSHGAAMIALRARTVP